MFEPNKVFESIYHSPLNKSIQQTIISFEASSDKILRPNLINIIEKHFQQFFNILTNKSRTASDIHRSNLAHFEADWRDIQSTNTCLSCLRRRPQYGLSCGHVICENCVQIFGDCSPDDIWLFFISRYFLCNEKMPEDINIRVRPPTAGVGVLYIDKGGTQGIVPLGLMKRIEERIGLPIPFQDFFKIAHGISSDKFYLENSSIYLYSL